MSTMLFVTGIIVLAVDQISKLITSSYIKIGDYISIVPNFLSLTNKQNTGAAFGILENSTGFLILISLFGLIIIYRYIRTFKVNVRNKLAFGFLLGGVTGNLIDRVFLGYVRDFIDVNIFGYNFPTFNIADSMILIGVTLLIYAIIKGEDELSENKNK